MPVHKVKGGYRWGNKGHGHKTYKTKAGAQKQARAIYANGWRGDSVDHAAVFRAHAKTRTGEAQYVKALRGIMKSLHEAVVRIVEPGIPFLAGQRLDVTRWGVQLEDRLRGLLDQLEDHVGPAFDAMSGTVASQAVATQTELLGFRSPPAGLEAEAGAARAENLRLMRAAGETYADEIQAVMDNPNTWDLTVEDLFAVIAQRGDASMARAALIARDQVYKLNAGMSRRMQESAGVEEYWWSTCRDERVRPTHRENEGRVFAWTNPPVKTGHPGHDPNCRCLAIPIARGLPPKSRAEKIAELMRGFRE